LTLEIVNYIYGVFHDSAQLTVINVTYLMLCLTLINITTSIENYMVAITNWDRRGCDRMVVGLTV